MMARRSTTALLCAAALLTAAPGASAYCRSRAAKDVPADIDPSKTGVCPNLDKPPLFWRNSCVGYSIQNKVSHKVSLDTAADLIATAFTRWTGATCDTVGSGRSRVSIDVRYLGLVECGEIKQVPGAANQNVIIFRDDSWTDPNGKPRPSSVLGLTTVNYNADTGEIYGADMEINTHDMDPLVFYPDLPPPGPSYDFLSVVTHEAGHFLGMGHSDVQKATMFAAYNEQRGETDLRTLKSDDILGICEVYRPDGERSVRPNGVKQDKVFASPECDPTPRGGYSSVCQEKPGPKCVGSTSPAEPELGLGWLGGALLFLGALRRRLGSRPFKPR